MLVAEVSAGGEVRQALVNRHAEHAEDKDLAQVRADLPANGRSPA